MALRRLAILLLLFMFSKAEIKLSELHSAHEDFRLNTHS